MLDVGFNREVAEEGALYWPKDRLQEVIQEAENLSSEDINQLADKAKQRVTTSFTWDHIVDRYESLLLRGQ